MGQTRQIVGPVLLWLLVAAIIGALATVPPWSTEIAQTMAKEPWMAIGQFASPAVMIIVPIFYLGMLIRTWMTAEFRSFVRLLFGLGTTLVITIVSFILQNTFGNPRPCHIADLGGSCPADASFAYPSSFAVIAFALAVSLAYSVPWTAYLAFPLAILEGVSSVVAGHQYPHDVVAGLALGAIGGIGLLYMFIKVQRGIAEKMIAKRQA